MSIHQLVTEQFSPIAASYAVSAVHANSDSLAEVVALLQPKAGEIVLDVATGAGHVAHSVAPYVAKVVAYDLTQTMLDQTLKSAKEKGLDNVEIVQGPAEALPFEDGAFDAYTVRLAPHHFADLEASINEAARVLKPGGRYLVVDTSSPEDLDLARQLDEIETLRDPSHVHNYSLSEWTKFIVDAGMKVVHSSEGFCDAGEPMDFDDWTTRMRTPAESVAELRRRFTQASPALRDLLEIQVEGEKIGFRLPRVTLLAFKD